MSLLRIGRATCLNLDALVALSYLCIMSNDWFLLMIYTYWSDTLIWGLNWVARFCSYHILTSSLIYHWKANSNMGSRFVKLTTWNHVSCVHHLPVQCSVPDKINVRMHRLLPSSNCDTEDTDPSPCAISTPGYFGISIFVCFAWHI